MSALFCVQCAMEDLIANRSVQFYDETAQEHMKRVHPDPVATERRREELEHLFAQRRLDGDPRRI